MSRTPLPAEVVVVGNLGVGTCVYPYGDGVDTRALLVEPQGTALSVTFMYRDGRRKSFYDGKGYVGIVPDLAICRAVMETPRPGSTRWRDGWGKDAAEDGDAPLPPCRRKEHTERRSEK